MKSKVKYAVLVLVIGLLGLAILPSSVFGGKPEPYKYNIKIVDINNQTVAEFVAYGNKDMTRIVGYEKYQMGYVPVDSMVFPGSVVSQLSSATDEAARFNDYPPSRALYWSPLEDNYLELIPNFTEYNNKFDGLEDQWQDLNSNEDNQWEYHGGSLDYRNNTLSFRFDMFYTYYDDEGVRGAHDHYILGIEMEFWENGMIGNATLNWTHYTEPIKPRGKNLQVDFQQLKCPSYHEVTITITESTEVP